jgi:hypothetical protein
VLELALKSVTHDAAPVTVEAWSGTGHTRNVPKQFCTGANDLCLRTHQSSSSRAIMLRPRKSAHNGRFSSIALVAPSKCFRDGDVVSCLGREMGAYQAAKARTDMARYEQISCDERLGIAVFHLLVGGLGAMIPEFVLWRDDKRMEAADQC